MVGLSYLAPLTPPKMSTRRAFGLAWLERRVYAKPITRWSEIVQAMSLWQSKQPKFPTIEQFAQSINCKPREAKQAADELRKLGVKLPHKENEEKYAPREEKPFPWVDFGLMLIKTRSPKMVQEAFQLSDEAFEKRVAHLAEKGVKFPEMQWGDTPEWIKERLHFFLYPHKYTPEERRTLGSKFRVKRPKGKKRYYYNGTGCYRPNKYERGERKLRHMSIGELKQLLRYSV